MTTAYARGNKSVQLRAQAFVDHLRVGLAGHRLHRLANEETEQRLLAGLVFGDLVGVGGEDLVDLGVDRAGVAGLLEPALSTIAPRPRRFRA
jgi:hypothetical protein